MSLPNGYRQLEYIKSSGTQYVDSGFKPNQDTRVFCDAVFVASSTAYWLFGARNGIQDRTFGFLTYNNQYRSDYNTSVDEYLTAGQSGRFTVDKDGNVTKINGETAKTATAGTFQCTHNLYLLANNNNGTVSGRCSATLYSCQIYDNGTLIRDYIPCQTASGEIGLWDDVNSMFYGNAGTGTFISGGYTSLKTGDILNYDYTGVVQSVTLPKGVYKLEVWGAQGGSAGSYGTTSTGGNGGYSIGIITLTAETVLHIYVGGQGTYSTTSGSFVAGGFNGGGKAGYRYGGSGGGASDIRIGTDSLYSRVIVAGGGGGGWSHSNYNGGVGGGTSGGQGAGYNPSFLAGAGTQTTGGAGNGYSSSYSGSDGAFGVGGNGASNSSSYNRSSGGGGGWYGGGGSGYRSSSSYYYRGGGGAGGGSGFVWTGLNAPSGYLLGPEYYLADASTIAGNVSMPSTSGGTETGHTGNGYARITAIKVDSLNLPVNIGGTWKEANEAFVNIGGTWKTVEAAFVNIGGIWKELG